MKTEYFTATLVGTLLIAALVAGGLFGVLVSRPAPPRESKQVTISYNGKVIGAGVITERGEFRLDSKKLGWEVEVQVTP